MRSHFIHRGFVACWCAFAMYCLLSATVGPAGLLAYKELEGRTASMRANLDSLRRSNDALAQQFQSLRSDPGRAGREARALGYLADGENALIVGGMDENSGSHGQEGVPVAWGKSGGVVRVTTVTPLGDLLIKEISLLIGFIVFGAGLASDALRQNAAGPRRAHAHLRT